MIGGVEFGWRNLLSQCKLTNLRCSNFIGKKNKKLLARLWADKEAVGDICNLFNPCYSLCKAKHKIFGDGDCSIIRLINCADLADERSFAHASLLLKLRFTLEVRLKLKVDEIGKSQ